jgi:hypothetical protein
MHRQPVLELSSSTSTVSSSIQSTSIQNIGLAGGNRLVGKPLEERGVVLVVRYLTGFDHFPPRELFQRVVADGEP